MFERLKKGVSGLVNKITTTELKADELNKVLSDFKLNLIENDVALPVAEQICDHMEKRLEGVQVRRLQDRREIVKDNLKDVLLETMSIDDTVNLLGAIDEKRRERDNLDMFSWWKRENINRIGYALSVRDLVGLGNLAGIVRKRKRGILWLGYIRARRDRRKSNLRNYSLKKYINPKIKKKIDSLSQIYYLFIVTLTMLFVYKSFLLLGILWQGINDYLLYNYA